MSDPTNACIQLTEMIHIMILSLNLHKHFLPINFLFTHNGEVETLCDAVDCQQQDIQTVPPQ